MAQAPFNSEILKRRLTMLNSKQKIAFGILCCERILPNYVAFQRDAGWGDVNPLRRSLDFIWSLMSDRTISSQDVKKAIISCEAVVPSSDDFESLYVTSAQDACFSVCSLLDFLLQNDVAKIVEVATYATDSVDLYVQEIEHMNPGDPELESKILSHDLMQRELLQQEKDLQTIEQNTSVTPELVARLKEEWDNGGKSNLNLP